MGFLRFFSTREAGDLKPKHLPGRGLVGADVARPPMEQWPKSVVVEWLQQLKQNKELDFDVARLACDGELFASRTKEDMKEIAGGLVGIDIFNAKEKKLADLKASPTGRCQLPFEFEERVIEGTSLVSVRIDARSAPLFLWPETVASLKMWVDTAPEGPPIKSTESLLAVTGSVKSGKSTLLLEVLPALLARHHAENPDSREPVVFSHTLTLGLAHEQNSTRLHGAASDFGAEFGLDRSPPSTNFDVVLHKVAQRVWQQGRQLVVLLDEVQAPVVASDMESGGKFVALLKETVRQLTPVARVAATGSSVLSLLTQIKRARVNGFELWGATAFARVGEELPESARLPVATAMGAHFAQHGHAANLEELVCLLSTDTLLSVRPALMANVLGFVSPSVSLPAALLRARRKLVNETIEDATIALGRLSTVDRAAIVSFANGSGIRDGFELKLVEAVGERNGTLQPPYPALFRDFMAPDGRMLVSHDERGLKWTSPATLECIVIVDALDQMNTSPEAKRSAGQAGFQWFVETFEVSTVQDAQRLECVVAMRRILDEDWTCRKKKRGESPTSSNLRKAASVEDFACQFAYGIRCLDAHCLRLGPVSAMTEAGLPPMEVEAFLRRYCSSLPPPAFGDGPGR